MLQEAAGYFRLLHDVVAPQLDEVPSFDISTNCTQMLELLMLAQAQESFFQKASRDKKNPAVLARYACMSTASKHIRLHLCRLHYSMSDCTCADQNMFA